MCGGIFYGLFILLCKRVNYYSDINHKSVYIVDGNKNETAPQQYFTVLLEFTFYSSCWNYFVFYFIRKEKNLSENVTDGMVLPFLSRIFIASADTRNFCVKKGM